MYIYIFATPCHVARSLSHLYVSDFDISNAIRVLVCVVQ